MTKVPLETEDPGKISEGPASGHAVSLLLQREHILAELEGFLNEIQRDKPAIDLCFPNRGLYYKLKEVHHEWDKHHPPEKAVDLMLAEAKRIEKESHGKESHGITHESTAKAWEDMPPSVLGKPEETEHVDRPCPCGSYDVHDVRDHEMS